MSSNNIWINNTKNYANKNNIPYKQALSDPNNRFAHHTSQSARNGMLSTFVAQLPVKDHSGYNPYQDKKLMNAYADLAKSQNNSSKTQSTKKYYI